MAAENASNPTGAGGNPPTAPINPFFAVPGLSADGDFEVLGVNVHHSLEPPPNAFFSLPDLGASRNSDAFGAPEAGSLLPSFIQPFDFSSDSDSISGLGHDKTGSDNPGGISDNSPIPSDQDQGAGGGGDTNGDYPYNDHSLPARDQDEGTGVGEDSSGDPPYLDHTFSGGGGGSGLGREPNDADNGAGGDLQAFDGLLGKGDHSISGGKPPTPTPTADSDNGSGRDFGGANWDSPNHDHSDSDHNSGFGWDYQNTANDGGDTSGTKPSGGGNGGGSGTGGGSGGGSGSGGLPPGHYTIDSDYGIGLDIADPSGDHGDKSVYTPVLYIPADGDSFTCDAFTMGDKFGPPTGGGIAEALIGSIMVVLATIPDLLLLPWGIGEGLVLEAIEFIDSLFEEILKHLGASDPLALLIKNILSYFNVKTSPLDFLKLGERAASTLQPALTSIHNKNVMYSVNLVAKYYRCLPRNCYNAYKNVIASDGTLFDICYDGEGGKDFGDHQGGKIHILGIEAGKKG